MPFLASLDHLVLTVADVQKTIDFYCGVLGCEEVTFGDNRKAIRFGDQKINLLEKLPDQEEQKKDQQRTGKRNADAATEHPEVDISG